MALNETSDKHIFSKEREEKVAVKAFLEENRIIVPPLEDREGLSSRGYGKLEDGNFLLTFYEALYLLSRSILEVVDEKTEKKVTFQHLLEKARSADEDAWVRYLIYRDLRSRGYVVREGFGLGIDFRVYRRGEYGKSTADFLILGIKEGQPIVIEDLTRILTRGQSLKKTLILSVLNRRGEIVYYSLSRLTFT